MSDHPLIARLRELDLPRGHWALHGSGPLLLRGWIDEVGDLDVVCRGPAWERALEVGEITILEPDGVEIVAVDGGAITIGRSWRYGETPIDTYLDTAEDLDGIPCVRLEHIVAYKRIAGRPKDVDHLRVIGEHRG